MTAAPCQAPPLGAQSASPLGLPNVKVGVRDGGGAFVLRIVSEDREIAQEVVARAQRALERSEMARL